MARARVHAWKIKKATTWLKPESVFAKVTASIQFGAVAALDVYTRDYDVVHASNNDAVHAETHIIYWLE